MLVASLLDRDHPQAAEALTLLDSLPVDHWTEALRGTALRHVGRPEEAVAAFDRALAQAPERAQLWLNRAQAAHVGDMLDIAAESAARYRAARPEDPRGYGLGAETAAAQRDFGTAVALAEQALALDPKEPSARRALAAARFEAGDAAGALALLGDGPVDRLLHWYYRLAGEEDPWPETLRRERWGCYRRPATQSARGGWRGRPLRVGYLSPDFRRHACAGYLEPLLAHHDPAAIEARCYAEVARPDAVTAQFQALVAERWGAESWVFTDRLEDRALGERILADRLDVLVDLAGYTTNGRTAAMERRLAPLQLGWLGYPEKTGAADARLVDSLTDPVDQPEVKGEKLIRMEGFLCWRPPAAAPPALRVSGEGVRFGSLNASHKLSDACLSLWREVLDAVPGSQLLLKARGFDDPWVRQAFEARCAKVGLDPTRLSLMGYRAESADHLALYQQIDVALDSFPYTGTTTSLEALWMGAPLVTLRGHSHRARVTAAILRRIGLDTWIADDRAGYVAIAAQLARQVEQGLDQDRAALRQRLADSVWCDAAGFARRMEQTMRDAYAAL